MSSEMGDVTGRLRPEALVVAYAMSRLDKGLLAQLGFKNWTQAFASTSSILSVPHNSMKLLRDEFDVFFDNGRRGWINRPPHPSRVAVLREFEGVSDEALVNVIKRTLAQDTDSVKEIMEIISNPATGTHNVAERLLTGKRAEEYFVQSCEEILRISADSLVDMRHQACGFDFQSSALPDVALEIKGLRDAAGQVLFTDREWTEAERRRERYWVIVVGDLQITPRARVYKDPHVSLPAQPRLVPTTAMVWTAKASVS